jgi:hypothetical protein
MRAEPFTEYNFNVLRDTHRTANAGKLAVLAN